MEALSDPAPLAEDDDTSHFSSGVSSIDDWLRDKAQDNETKGATRTFVVRDDDRIAGFYSLAAASIGRKRVPSSLSRNMPEPIPVFLLARLAVATDYQGQGLGSDLLADAVRRASETARNVAASAITVQALDENVKRFYKRAGFRPFSKDEPLMLYLPMSVVPDIPTPTP